jgi:uncharacterized protein YjiS (DUF1127 family)
MFSFNEKDLNAVAMLRPNVANNNTIDIDSAIANAHRLRSEYFRGMVGSAFSGLIAKYVRYRSNQRAIAQLNAMSNYELSDLGVSRSNIEHAVMGEDAMVRAHRLRSIYVGSLIRSAVSKVVTVVSATIGSVASSYKETRLRKNGYQQLMAMDARQLSDIGLTRSQVSAAVSGRGSMANDNHAISNNNGGRKVS